MASTLDEKNSVTARRARASYGLDAPFWPVVLVLIGTFDFVEGIVSHSPWPFVGAVVIFICAISGLHASLRGKFVVWQELLDGLALRGDEQVLDIGCGRGAVLLAVAKRLPHGKAVGIDIWRKADQSGNSIEATRRNAVAEGVADRIELQTADMTALPFEDGSFDLVVSSLAIHNVKGKENRRKAIAEAVRVLRPGGRLLIADIWSTALYCAELEATGMRDVTRRRLGWRMSWSGPFLGTRAVSAVKPSA
ncbi:MAG TPA: class I SAM-dependent methyltransferase [Tepidisphaeraceae bacterium]|nr:class I SAM-dependent methyltransferase [Tepidisphaeraceae bacterium]